MEQIKRIILKQKTFRPAKRRRFFVKKTLTKKTMVEGFSKIPNTIIQDPGLSCQDFRVLSILIFHSFGKYWCNPSHRTIMKEAGISLAGVKRGLRKAQKLGYISWKRTGKSNNYVLIWKARDMEKPS